MENYLVESPSLLKQQYLNNKTKHPVGMKNTLFSHLLGLPQGNLTAHNWITVKILKIGTPEIITIIVLQLEQLDFTVQYCVQKMQTE